VWKVKNRKGMNNINDKPTTKQPLDLRDEPQDNLGTILEQASNEDTLSDLIEPAITLMWALIGMLIAITNC